MTNIQEGAQSDSIKDYKLPIINVDKQKRNFEGYKKEQWYNLEDLKVGQSNVIDTASDKHRATMRPFKSSSPRSKDN
jgi:hypothetical protein